MIKIYDTDTATQIAHKIFHDFEVHQNCCIYGFEVDEKNMKLEPKGELVWRELNRLDIEVNCSFLSNGKKTRGYKYKKDSIGGTIAQKIFTRDIKVIDKVPRWTIWRYQ